VTEAVVPVSTLVSVLSGDVVASFDVDVELPEVVSTPSEEDPVLLPDWVGVWFGAKQPAVSAVTIAIQRRRSIQVVG
jgi:hypothetical protein